MEKKKRKKGHGCLFTVILVVVLAAAIWFIGTSLVNNKAESLVDEMVQEHISLANLPLEYGEFTVNIAQGQIGLTALKFPLAQESTITADMIEIKVSPKELITLALGKTSGLSTASVYAERFGYSAGEMSLDFASGTLDIEGNLDAFAPEDSIIRKVHLVTQEVQYTIAEGLSVASKEMQLDVKGNLNATTLQKDFNGILDDVWSLDLKATGGTILPDAQMVAQLGMFATASPWIADPNNWKFDSVAIEARSLEDAIVLDSLALTAPLMEAAGSVSLPRGNSQAVSMKLNVEKLHSQVRTELAPIALFMGQEIPSEAFEFDFAWDGIGFPLFTFN
ncbi:MAG: hypothetical protein WC239_13020 [Sphaerochaetaceae bacterium]